MTINNILDLLINLKVAREIQMSIVPKIFPPFPKHKEFDIYALLNPPKEVGGDLYDFFLIDDDHLCFIIGDVSGMFFTEFLGIMTISNGEVKYANGRHNRPYVLRTGGTLEMLPKIPGIALGAMGNMPFAGERLILNTGDSLIMYTDGVTEAMNHQGELFGETRLEKALENTSEKSEKDLTNIILDANHQHVKDAEQFKDITILAIKYTGSKNYKRRRSQNDNEI